MMTETQIQECLLELKREYRMREHAYPKWIAQGKLKQDESNRRMERLLRAIKHFEGLLAVTPKDQGSLL